MHTATLLRRLGQTVGVGAICAAGMAGLTTSPASAASTPLATYSVYVTSMSGTAAYNEGCKLGTAAEHGTMPSNAAVILDFGYPIDEGGTWGTLLLTSTYPFETLPAIEAVVENYAWGFYECTAHQQLVIGIGENTNYVCNPTCDDYYFNATDGSHWATMVNAVNSYFGTNGLATQITAAGAADMENGSGWASFSLVKAWADAYSAGTSYFYFDFGSAGGCPYTDVYNNRSCSNGWNQYDEWYASWGAARAVPAPEDYNDAYKCPTHGCSYGSVDSNSREWEAIDRYGYHYQSSGIIVQVVLTKYEACVQKGLSVCHTKGVDNTVAKGDSDMYNALNHDWAPYETAQTIPWTTDFEWGYAK